MQEKERGFDCKNRKKEKEIYRKRVKDREGKVALRMVYAKILVITKIGNVK